jgi:hypothetical protein
VLHQALITKKINDLARKNPAKYSRIRNPRATRTKGLGAAFVRWPGFYQLNCRGLLSPVHLCRVPGSNCAWRNIPEDLRFDSTQSYGYARGNIRLSAFSKPRSCAGPGGRHIVFTRAERGDGAEASSHQIARPTVALARSAHLLEQFDGCT